VRGEFFGAGARLVEGSGRRVFAVRVLSMQRGLFVRCGVHHATRNAQDGELTMEEFAQKMAAAEGNVATGAVVKTIPPCAPRATPTSHPLFTAPCVSALDRLLHEKATL